MNEDQELKTEWKPLSKPWIGWEFSNDGKARNQELGFNLGEMDYETNDKDKLTLKLGSSVVDVALMVKTLFGEVPEWLGATVDKKKNPVRESKFIEILLLDGEEFRDIPEYPEHYQISNMGRLLKKPFEYSPGKFTTQGLIKPSGVRNPIFSMIVHPNKFKMSPDVLIRSAFGAVELPIIKKIQTPLEYASNRFVEAVFNSEFKSKKELETALKNELATIRGMR